MAVWRRVRKGIGRMSRLQRRVWLAESLVGPALMSVAAIGLATAGWRSARRRRVRTVELPDLAARTAGPGDDVASGGTEVGPVESSGTSGID